MNIEVYQVDAFASEPFAGNPAAVCLLETEADEDWMQKVAHEMNLSETAFIVPKNGDFDLRWFTPMTEVDLCGHATLASAHILWETEVLPGEAEAIFHTRSGVLRAKRSGGGWIELDFPSEPVEMVLPEEVPAGFLEALRLEEAQYIGRNRFDYLVEVGSEKLVRNIKPDFRTLAQIVTRGVIVTAKAADEHHDFVSRFFAPGEGIDEDPVTGSAHCALGPYWGNKFEKTVLTGYQASRRGGAVKIELTGKRIKLSGQAVTILRGELTTGAVKAPDGPAVKIPAARGKG